MSDAKGLKDNPKVVRILDCALTVMREEGDTGLSMRKVAACAGMSLGNLQYYFKNKDALLGGMVDVYFAQCAESFAEAMGETMPGDARELLTRIMHFGMESSDSDMGRTFGELWVMAERDETVRAALHAHYRGMIDDLAALLVPFAASEAAAENTLALLIPFCDGVRNTGPTLPVDRAALTRVVIDAALFTLKGRGE